MISFIKTSFWQVIDYIFIEHCDARHWSGRLYVLLMHWILLGRKEQPGNISRVGNSCEAQESEPSTRVHLDPLTHAYTPQFYLCREARCARIYEREFIQCSSPACARAYE
eukprot:IDg7968t1